MYVKFTYISSFLCSLFLSCDFCRFFVFHVGICVTDIGIYRMVWAHATKACMLAASTYSHYKNAVVVAGTLIVFSITFLYQTKAPLHIHVCIWVLESVEALACAYTLDEHVFVVLQVMRKIMLNVAKYITYYFSVENFSNIDVLSCKRNT